LDKVISFAIAILMKCNYFCSTSNYLSMLFTFAMKITIHVVSSATLVQLRFQMLPLVIAMTINFSAGCSYM